MKAPILEFYNEPGIIDEKKYVIEDRVKILQKHKIDTALFVFTRDIYEEIDKPKKLEEFFDFANASAIYKWYLYDKKFVIAIAPVGAAASGSMMELLGYMGIRNFFACGSCGRIDEKLSPTDFVLVEKAIRCEGVSYRYAKPDLYALSSEKLTKHISNFLDTKKFTYKKGITWTTDSFFRETKSEIAKRKKQGAVCVEMEAAAWCSIARYRNYNFAQLLYFSDGVKKEGWELYDTVHMSRKSIISLMIECTHKFVKENKK